MRGEDVEQPQLFSYVSLEARVPKNHPLRRIRTLFDQVLDGLSGEFDRLYADSGRPSIPPEKLLRALLLQALYTVRSERLLMEQLNYNLLFRWFVGLEIDDPVWHPTTFTKNRDRLVSGAVAQRLLQQLTELPEIRRLLSDEHVSVDGTLIEAWTSMKSFVPCSQRARKRIEEFFGWGKTIGQLAKTWFIDLDKVGWDLRPGWNAQTPAGRHL